jgi:heptosyltransferase-1
MLGGPADGEAAGRIQAQSDACRAGTHGYPHDAGLVNLAGTTSLLQAAALIESSQLVIGVDTGLSHMGIAFGRPTLLLFGSTRPYLDTGRADARVLYHPLPCSPCKRRPTCQGSFDCMRLIREDEVLSAARDVLGAEPGEASSWIGADP